jgi:hypothetical protein
MKQKIKIKVANEEARICQEGKIESKKRSRTS